MDLRNNHQRQIFQCLKTDISIYILIILMNNHFKAPMVFSNGMSQIHTSLYLYVSMFLPLNVFASQCFCLSMSLPLNVYTDYRKALPRGSRPRHMAFSSKCCN